MIDLSITVSDYGEGRGTRTPNLRIRSALLYPLSYTPMFVQQSLYKTAAVLSKRFCAFM